MKTRGSFSAALRLCGAMIGAGFATGGEIQAFFSRFGAWSWLGVIAAAGTLALLGSALVPVGGRVRTMGGCFPGAAGWVPRGALLLLLVTTGGAMVAAAAELAALTLPVHGAAWAGGLGTLGLAWMLSRRGAPALTALSGVLMALLAGLMAFCWLLPEAAGFALPESSVLPPWLEACGGGLCWGGFNLAFAGPLLCGGEGGKRSPRLAAVMLGGLLAMGNGLLLRHPETWESPLPMVALLAQLGKAGYYGGAGALYLAILTTLIAVLRGMRELLPSGMAWRDGAALMGIAAVSVAKFRGIVGVGYPLLGAICLCLTVAGALHARRE